MKETLIMLKPTQ